MRLLILTALLVRWLLLGASGEPVREVQLAFELEKPKLADVAARDAGGRELRISRCDFLVSGLAAQRQDGSWLESAEWYGVVSFGQGRTRVSATGLPAQDFQALRFYIGPDAAADAGDANQWPVGHALHPLAAGLHWSWQGGYVFLALEGHEGKEAGWSWHLATDARRTLVTLPAKFHAGTTGTIRIGLDLGKLTKAVDLAKDGSATHSRPGDALAGKLQAALSGAFSVKGISSDRLQISEGVAKSVPKGTTPYAAHISARLPKVQLPKDNPLTVEGVTLGKRLFQETALSADDSLSCVRCHQQSAAFADAELPRSSGIKGQLGKRNAMPLFNLAWQDEFFWDGRVRGLRNQIWHPITDATEMGSTRQGVLERLQEKSGYAGEFAKAFGSPGITEDRVGLALEQFLLSLVSQNARYDKAARQELKLTAEEQHGLALFLTEYDPARGLHGADCFHCHGGNLFTNNQFANNGVLDATDSGRAAVTKLPADAGKFRVPSLRNLTATAPYMHDGRFRTLAEVVDHYDHGLHRSPNLDPNLAKHPATGLGLSPEDKRALVAFLETLTDESFLSTNSVK